MIVIEREGFLSPWEGSHSVEVLILGPFLLEPQSGSHAHSMIGLTDAPRSNVQPPTTVLIALAVWQCGAALLFEDVGNRVLARAGLWAAVIGANSMIMTLYLWNMSAVVLDIQQIVNTFLAG